MTSEISCEIENVTYFDEKTGYGVLRVKSNKGPVTAVGNFLNPCPGESYRLRGEWVNHPKYGRQIKVEFAENVLPATAEGIRKYLGSGLIKGIGPAMAGRIVDVFGERTLDIIEDDIGRLNEVSGIGPGRIEKIQKAWTDQKAIRKVMMFLQQYGVSTTYAVKIFKEYGDDAIKVVSENPYRLAHDVWGIGFKTADKIAGNMGISSTADIRVDAGILFVLHQLSNEGHVCYPHESLVSKAAEILEVDSPQVDQGISRLIAGKEVVSDLFNDQRYIFLHKFYFCEVQSVSVIKKLLSAKSLFQRVNVESAITDAEKKSNFRLAVEQRKAVTMALQNKFMILTGGPGTGKTTIVKTIIDVFSKYTREIHLAAPTGRAAQKMQDATGLEAKTIHRLLEFSPSGKFKYNKDKPLPSDLLILDESSMIDTTLFYHLLNAVPARATVIMVGDVDQLPSVGAGNVLKDIINSGVVPVARLTEIFRQARDSSIITSAHEINHGRFPVLTPRKKPDDFYFIEDQEPELVFKRIIALVSRHIPERLGYNPVNQIQVLSPMRRGGLGVESLNSALQDSLNPADRQKPEIVRGGSSFRLRDKVMQIKNNYEKEVFNGDIGNIVSIDHEEKELAILFDQRRVVYDFMDLDELVLAYAVTIHKAQGSEYPVVVIPVTTQHYIMLQRNLLYTGVTRGKKMVILVGTKKALGIAVRNNSMNTRHTLFSHRLSLAVQVQT
jgi:exodeoxyribonuclease V alpha subunit